MPLKSTPTSALEGFLGDLDFAGMAAKAARVTQTVVPPLALVTDDEAVGHMDSRAHSVPKSEAVGQPQNRALGQPHDEAVGHISSRAVGQPHDEAVGHVLTRGVRGLSVGQEPVLRWLIERCGSCEPNTITYKMIQEQLGISLKACRVHLDSLVRKGLISASVATRPGSMQPIGRYVQIYPDAHLAIALARNGNGGGNKSSRAVGQPHDGAVGQMGNRAIGQTLCGGSDCSTTTTAEDEAFRRLVLDEWEGWGLRAKALGEHLASKPSALQQEILDKAAYCIRQKEGTDHEIRNKIGFLINCLNQEFCDVDGAYISREERIRKKRTEQLRAEAARIKAAKEEEEQAAIEVLVLQLNQNEREELRQQAIERIMQDAGPTMKPGGAMIDNYQKLILVEMARERGLLT